MRAVIQRVKGAKCVVNGDVTGEFMGPGLVVLLGVTHTDGVGQVEKMARKIANLRIFDAPDAYDPAGGSEKLVQARGAEASALQLGLPVLLVSQFTLYGDARKGNRPSWVAAAPGEVAQPLVDAVGAALKSLGMQVERGIFGADMQVSFTNDGPVTILIEV